MKLNTKAIGKRIKELRKQQNLTQEQLAEMADISTHYVYEIEAGLKTMSCPILAAIACSLHTSADYLLFGSVSYDLEADSPSRHDQLEHVISMLSSPQRNQVAHILSVIVPYLKE